MLVKDLHKVSRKRLLGIVGIILIALVTCVTVWSTTWTSCKVSMIAHTASVVSIGQYEDCECTIPFEAYDWDGLVSGQVYLCPFYLKNTGSKGVYLSYKPSYLSFSDDQARFYIDIYVLEKGLPCQLYPVDPSVELPEKDPTICDGYFLGPGKVVKLVVALWVQSLVYGETYQWNLIIYGCAP